MFATEAPSVLGYVKLVLLQCKAFKDEITQAFELMLKVIKLHPAIVKKYVESIIEVGRRRLPFVTIRTYVSIEFHFQMCLTYISPKNNPAHLRKKAAEIIYQLLTQKLIDDVNKEFVNHFIRILRKDNISSIGNYSLNI